MLWRKAFSYLGGVGSGLIVFAAMGGATLLCFVDTAAHAQQPTADDFIAEAEGCRLTGLCGGGGGGQAATSRIGYDPCYLAQNAMRPCTSADMKALQPHGVDPNLVGALATSAEERSLGAHHQCQRHLRFHAVMPMTVSRPATGSFRRQQRRADDEGENRIRGQRQFI